MAIGVEILSEIQKFLNEEKISKHSIEAYSRKDFIRLEEIIDKAIEEGIDKEVENFCASYLEENPSSILANYAIGLIYLKTGAIDTSYMPEVIKRFSDAKKGSMVVFLAEKVLSFSEEKYALKILEEYYKSLRKDEEEIVDIRERIIKIDKKDAHTAKVLAEYYESVGNLEKAIYYYKITLERFISLKSASSAEHIWDKLISLHIPDYKFLMSASIRLGELISHEKIGKSLHKVASYYKKKGMFKEALEIMKFVFVKWVHNDVGVKSDLRELYSIVYPNHSMLDTYWEELMEYLRSKLQSYIRVSSDEIAAKLNEFEKKLKFDVGKYVYHRIMGVGVIKDIKDNWIYIDFSTKPGHKMSTEIAFSSLDILVDDDLRIWKEYKLGELKKLIDESSPKVIKMILVSKEGKATAKEIKDALKEIVDEKRADHFWNSVKPKLSEENVFPSAENRNLYILSHERNIESKLEKDLNSSSSFGEKMKIVYTFVNQGGNLNISQAKVLVDFLRHTFEESKSVPESLQAGLVLLYSSKENFSENDREKLFERLLGVDVDTIIELIEKIEIMDIKRLLLSFVKQTRKDWTEIFSEVIFRTSNSRINTYVFNELFNYGKTETIKKVVNQIVSDIKTLGGDRFKIYSKYIWLTKLLLQEEYEEISKNLGIDKITIVINLLKIVGVLASAFEERGERGMSRKLFIALKDVFSNITAIESVVMSSDVNTAFEIVSAIEDYDLVDTRILSGMKSKLYYKYPQLKNMEDSRSSRNPYLITKSTYDKIKREYDELLNEKLPEVTKQLSLNPNSQELIDKEEELKAIAERLSKELSEYKILKPDQVRTDIVDAGCKITLKSSDGEEIVYHLLGDKDAAPEKRIISYRSPLGAYLLDKSKGDKITINIEGKEKTFEVTKIEVSEYV